LAEATNNRILLRIVETTNGFLAKSRESYLLVEKRAERSLVHHQEILSAIKSGNGQLAARAMREHIEDIEETVVDT
ncbi:FadR/GntR family transcriptional regulator, partial [Thermodesulfobacteriota bacterium]